jgi:hypothetical protein
MNTNYNTLLDEKIRLKEYSKSQDKLLDIIRAKVQSFSGIDAPILYKIDDLLKCYRDMSLKVDELRGQLDAVYSSSSKCELEERVARLEKQVHTLLTHNYPGQIVPTPGGIL